jgi:hypothetical protein
MIGESKSKPLPMFRHWEPAVPVLGQSRRDFLVAFIDTKAARCRFYFY